MITLKNLLPAAVTALALLGSLPAQAEQLSPALYADQLDRCVGEIRADMAAPGTVRLQHELTAVERTGLWYVIKISTTAMDAENTITDQATTQCQAHRWTPQTVVDIRHTQWVAAESARRLAASD